MKKLMFAFACAASVCALADGDSTGNWANFEMLAGTTLVGNRNDAGAADSGPYFFSYERASGSTDGSVVKKYGDPDNIAAPYAGTRAAAFADDQFNNNYLELSTEGGTLWRNFTTAGGIGDETAGAFEGEHVLGAATDLTELALSGATIYVDTLVQFTPTEDGTAPAVANEDQLAIWLNVDSTDPEAPVTNLCVLAAQLQGSSLEGVKKTFTVPNKDQGGVDVVPGKWYRLTVKTISNVINDSTGFPGFLVYLDGTLLKTDTPSLDEDAAEWYTDYLVSGISASDVANGSVFFSLWAWPEANQDPSTPTFTAVGFKGSGAIDDLVVSTEEPNIFEAVDSLDFTLTWGEEISAVSYTINGVTASATKDVAIECDPNAEVTLTVTLTEPGWYTVDAASAAGFTVTEAGQTHTITASPIASPIADELLDDVKAWAKSFATALTPEQIAACAFAKNAYLMNTDLSAEPGLEITSITEVEDGWQITVKGTQGDNAVTLKGINGQLNIKAAATLEGLATAEATPVTLTDADFDGAGVATIKVTGDNKNFMKATVGVKATTPAAE